MNKNLIISTKTILTTLILVVLAILLYQIREVILQLVVAFVLALSVEPDIRKLMKRKIPRWAAVSFMFTLSVLLIILFFTMALPLLITQTRNLIMNLPQIVDSVVTSPVLKASLLKSISQFSLAVDDVFAVTFSVFANVFSFMTVFVFTLYLSLDLPNVKKRFLTFFADDLKDYVDDTWRSIEENLSRWIRGQILLMIVVGLSGYIGLLVLGVPYAASIGVIAGVLEVVPVIGPIVATVIAAVVGFAINPLMGVLVLAVFIGIQQLENSFLVPRIMQKIIGFNPLVTMIALLIGGKLFGVVGAIISIPIALVVVVIFHRLINLDLDN